MNLQKYEVLAQAAIDKALDDWKKANPTEFYAAQHKAQMEEIAKLQADADAAYAVGLAESHKIMADGMAEFNRACDENIRTFNAAMDAIK